MNEKAQPSEAAAARDFAPLLGEYAWHSLTLDPAIQEVSLAHYKLVRGIISREFPNRDPASLKVLEVACYAHTTGYHLARDLGSNVTLFELSAASLRLGRKLAGDKVPIPRLVIGDFHHLPFTSEEFDFVYICSALHHTHDYEVVASELMRVVSPGGVLFLENEPCLRQACFYKFRCNRLENLTAFEQHLHEAGWLRTIGEPYIGSRPETLFGMIENQQMPVDRLIDIFQTFGRVLNLELFPEVCMGTQEERWLNARALPQDQLTAMIRHDLRDAVRKASAKLGPAEEGLGFSLPTDVEISEFAELNACRLRNLPSPDLKDAYRRQLTNLFGGALRLTLRRNPRKTPASHEIGYEATIESDGIINGFPEETKALLGGTSLVPDIQSAGAHEMHTVFPKDQWQFVRSDNGICALHPLCTNARISLPSLPGDCLFFMRVYAACTPAWPSFDVLLSDQARDYAIASIYHPETHLLKCILTKGANNLMLRIQHAQQESDMIYEGTVPPVSIGSVGLFPLNTDNSSAS